MIISFVVAVTGHCLSVELNDRQVSEYRNCVQDMQRYFSPQLDRQRRAAHNKVSQPVLEALMVDCPELDPQELLLEARSIVTEFFVKTHPGRSRVGELRNSGSLI